LLLGLCPNNRGNDDNSKEEVVEEDDGDGNGNGDGNSDGNGNGNDNNVSFERSYVNFLP
jgi:hypothetical protein